MNRRQFLQAGAVAGVALRTAGRSRADEAAAVRPFAFDPSQNLIPAPRNPSQWETFRRQLAAWRGAARRELDYADALYRRPDFAWVSRCFSCCFLMLCDERFYDSHSGRYRVETFLADADLEFGGFDGVVLWHAYPRIGVDDRNQFDCYRDQPGGLAGLRQASRCFHRHGVAVFVDYNPWDTGTRREGRSDLDALAQIVGAIEADGIFLDTMSQGAAEFRARLDSVRPGVALEGELALPLETRPRSSSLLGAVVRRQRDTGRAAEQVVRAAPHAAPDQTLAPRPHRRTALRLDERQRHDGLGQRVRFVGWLVRT